MSDVGRRTDCSKTEQCLLSWMPLKQTELDLSCHYQLFSRSVCSYMHLCTRYYAVPGPNRWLPPINIDTLEVLFHCCWRQIGALGVDFDQSVSFYLVFLEQFISIGINRMPRVLDRNTVSLVRPLVKNTFALSSMTLPAHWKLIAVPVLNKQKLFWIPEVKNVTQRTNDHSLWWAPKQEELAFLCPSGHSRAKLGFINTRDCVSRSDLCRSADFVLHVTLLVHCFLHCTTAICVFTPTDLTCVWRSPCCCFLPVLGLPTT